MMLVIVGLNQRDCIKNWPEEGVAGPIKHVFSIETAKGLKRNDRYFDFRFTDAFKEHPDFWKIHLTLGPGPDERPSDVLRFLTIDGICRPTGGYSVSMHSTSFDYIGEQLSVEVEFLSSKGQKVKLRSGFVQLLGGPFGPYVIIDHPYEITEER